MRQKRDRQSGFTLIEMIVSLALVGVMAAVAGVGIVGGVRGYVFTRDNAAIGQKAQLGMTRLNRELMELAKITTAQASRVTYTRIVDGNDLTQTIYRDGTTNTIKLAPGTAATGGDTLVDNVSSFSLTYYKDAAPWVQGTDDIELLSAVAINLVLDRPGTSDTVTFTNVSAPRNNGNVGGATPGATPPAAPSYGAGSCFVATAAYGQANQPQVLVLRQFRDRYLFGWRGGEQLVRAYYAIGPALAGMIQGRPWACSLTRALLTPVVGMAFLMLRTPLALPLMLLLAWLLVRIFLPHRLLHPFKPRPCIQGARGSVLIGLLVSMVAFAALGAAMLSLTSTSTISQVGSNNAMRAYYLAESGYRYTASQFLNAGTEAQKDNALEALDTHIFTLSGPDGKFRLDVYPYFFKVTANPNGNRTMTTKVNGTIPADLNLSDGYLKVDGTVYEYSKTGQSGANITFTKKTGNWPSIAVDSSVYSVSRPNGAATLSNGNNSLNLETTTNSSGAFPIQNGSFKIEGSDKIYIYERRNNNVLSGIKRSPEEPFSVPLTSASNIVLEKFVKLKSTGIVADAGAMETRREILYFVPIGWAESGTPSTGKAGAVDNMNSMTNWFTGTGSGQLGSHAITNVGGNYAMSVSTAVNVTWPGETAPSIWSLINYNWTSANVNLANSWQGAGNLLSYDLQVKVAATNSYWYMGGLSFRLTDPGGGDLYMYGISFTRACQTRNRAVWGGGGWSGWEKNPEIPPDIVPDALFVPAPTAVGSPYYCTVNGVLRICQDRYSWPAIVLWMRSAAGFKWLAYELLTYNAKARNYVVSSSNRLVDWSNLHVRVIEAKPLLFTNGGTATPLYGDTIEGATSGATARVNGTPILTSGSWGGGNAAGTLTLDAVNGTFQNGEWLRINGSNIARASGALGARTNFIRAYYGDVSAHGTANATPTDQIRGANPRLASGASNVNWPVDDMTAWAGANDYMTLIQWDAINTGVMRIGTGTENNAIIRDGTLTSPASGTFTRSEIALHSLSYTADTVDFDDFAIQIPAPAGASTGFLPPIQQ